MRGQHHPRMRGQHCDVALEPGRNRYVTLWIPLILGVKGVITYISTYLSTCKCDIIVITTTMLWLPSLNLSCSDFFEICTFT